MKGPISAVALTAGKQGRTESTTTCEEPGCASLAQWDANGRRVCDAHVEEDTPPGMPRRRRVTGPWPHLAGSRARVWLEGKN